MKIKIIAAFTLCLLLIDMAHAQFTNDSQPLVINGGTYNVTDELFVGYTNSFDQMQVVNGGILQDTNGYEVYVGYDAGADNNSVVVSGNGSVWTGGGTYVGYYGSGNSLTVSNGAEMFIDLLAGYQPGANYNSVLVTGVGSVLTPGHDWQIGTSGSFNSLVVNNGAVIDGGRNLEIGGGNNRVSSDSNSVLVAGSGSVITAGDLLLGNPGNGNSMTISNGAVVVSAFGMVGVGGGASGYGSDNCVVITDPGSAWTNTTVNGLTIGYGDQSFGNSVTVANGGVLDNSGAGSYIYGVSNNISVIGTGSVFNVGLLALCYSSGSAGGNTLTIANGGVVTSTEGYIGTGNHYNPAASVSDHNQVVVTGSGSLWTNSDQINIGDTGSANSLIINNGGTVLTRNMVIGYFTGYNTGSSNNLLLVSGGNLIVTNADGTGTLTVSATGASTNSFILNGGTVTVNALAAINGSNSVLTFNSGLLASGETTVSDNQIFAVGDGTNAATFQINGGIHSFANSLEVRSNATLSGCGTINSNVIVDAGGTVLVSCGGILNITGSITNNGTMRAINGSTLEASGTVVNNGTIDVINGATNFPGGFVNNGMLLKASSVIIRQTSISGQDVQIQVPSVIDHTYQLQYSTSLMPVSWTNTGASQVGSGSMLTLTDSGGATNGPTRFYHVAVTAP